MYGSTQRPATLLKKELWHGCFPVDFAKFLRTSFLQDNCGRLLLNIENQQPYQELLFLGGLSLPLFLTKESLESCEFSLLSFSSAKNSLSLRFFMKSSMSLFSSGMFAFGIDVNFRLLLKNLFDFQVKVYPTILIFQEAKSDAALISVGGTLALII